MNRSNDGSDAGGATVLETDSSALGVSVIESDSLGGFRHGLVARLHNRQVQRMLVNIAAIFGIGIYVQVAAGQFFTVRIIENISVAIAVIAIIACAETLVMIAGAIDISVAGTVVMAGIIGGLCVEHGMPIWLAVIVCTLFGALVGLFNSALVVVIGVTSLIATIGTLYVTQGIANLLTNGIPVAGLPPTFSNLGNGFIGSVPNSAVIILIAVGFFLGLQRFTVFGRYVTAAGSNAQSAFLNGINVRLTLTGCFVLCGATSGFAGMVYASRVGTPVPAVDNDLLFQVIVACVVGGTSLFGGEGSVFGTFLAAVLIGVLYTALDLLGVSTFWQYIALGILLVLAVGLDVGLRHDTVVNLRRRLLLLLSNVRGAGPPAAEATAPISQRDVAGRK